MLDSIDSRARDLVFNGLKLHNDKFARRNQSDFTITARINDEIIGVAMGESKYDWLILQYLWVNELHRDKGVGSDLMRQLDQLALRRELYGIHLDTFEFQARSFYEKMGFMVFGELEHHPQGFKRYFMKKTLGLANKHQQVGARGPTSPVG